MLRFPRCPVVTLAATVAITAWPNVAQAHDATVVGPTDSIQAAVDAAAPGDTILVFGTHRENVAVQTDRLTLRGVGAVMLPPVTPAENACFDPEAEGEAVHGICVIGDVDFGTGEISRYVEDVTIRGFTIRGFAGSAIAATAASETTVADNVATNNRDAGIIAAQSRDMRMRSNQASGSRFGILVSGALGGTVVANRVHDNCVGALLLRAAEFRIAANGIQRNTRVCPAVQDEWPALSGGGVLLIEANANTIVANLIIGNVPAGETTFSGGVVVATFTGTPSSENVVNGNVILRNEPDIFSDGTGAGNVFRDNLCRTSIPPELCD
jgi:parallel beta-helix repeat protein